MKYFLRIFVVATLVFAVSCKHQPAKIVNRSSIVYDKNNYRNKSKYSHVKLAKSRSRQSSKSNYSPSGKVIVRSGDSLYLLAKKHRVALRDLIKENNLTAPYILKAGDRISIPTPRYHRVQSGETLYTISRLYNTKINHLIELNDLKKPYSIKSGEKLRINKFSKKQRVKRPRRSRSVASKSSKKSSFFSKNLNKFSWPVKGKVISRFGPKSGGLYNDGINILAQSGTTVNAAEDGVVAYVGNELKGYGNLVILKHSGGWITAYAHLKDSSVKRGQKIRQGNKVGRVGMSGNVKSPQLYFGLRKGRDAVNPLNYLSRK